MNHSRAVRAGAVLVAALIVNTAYIAAFQSATIFYMANVVLHLGLGLVVLALALWLARGAGKPFQLAAGLLFLGALPALYLVYRGNTSDQRHWLWTHIVLSAAALAALAWRLHARPEFQRWRTPSYALLALLVALPAGTSIYARLFPNPLHRIANPIHAPLSMEEEGAGPQGPFWPSSARTNTGLIPSSYFLDSKQCGTCHKDIYEQWNSSVHHFASFNNQFYRKSIEYMQAVQGDTQPSRWCAACHDHALLFNGRWKTPIKDQIDTPEAHAGLGCLSCHAITRVHDSMGNAGFTLDYNDLHELASSTDPVIKRIDSFLTFLNPKPHRATFLKPFHRLDSSEFCSSCHKVHLDVPVNNYRWIRGFNDYDNWQASGVSGQGARSFYYPKESSTCSGCHMPLVPSKDPGNRNGMVHSHRFPGANMAVAHANQDQEQMRITEQFLKSGFITADIFSVSPVDDAKGEPPMLRRAADSAPRLMSTFAVGEEAEQPAQAVLREMGQVAAPLNRVDTAFTPGATVRVDVVIRTRKIGHFFPGGTVDAFDVWVELEGKDADGRHVFWSGRVEENGKGPVEKGAHFYRSYQLDGEGNPINKRNAFQTRSVLYVRLIPPGAADVAHYRVRIPKDARGPITLTAKLNYRKFAHYYTQFAYAGQPKPGQPASLVSAGHDSREYSFDAANIPANVSGRIKGAIPDLPIVTLASAQATLRLAGGSQPPAFKQTVLAEDYERWNDWGIGMLLQGDLKGAEYAFRKVTEAKPEYADGWLNVARALIQEGETEAAKPFIRRALEIDSSLGRIHFFQALIHKADGDYDAAIASLRVAASKYPRDRVVQNQLGRLLFLKREYRDALLALDAVLRVDPEDLQAHYTRMLCYRGLGDIAAADREERLFRRFKTDESAQTITARPRQLSPEDNNERQMIHDHESAPLALPKRQPAPRSVTE